MAIISPSRRFVFIHIQKCGGSSVEIAYAKRQRWDDLVLGSTNMGESIAPHYLEKFGLHKHSTAHEIRRIIGNETWDRYESIALIRRPEKIYESFYKWTHRLIENHLALSGRTRDDLRAEVEACPDEPSWNALSWGHFQERLFAADLSDYARRLMGRGLYARPLRSLREPKGDIICKHIFKLEEPHGFEKTFGELIEEPGFRLPHHNKGARLSRGELKWEQETLRRFVDLHREDYEALGYELPS